MKRIHTHYDNLQVARNASPEVIRAAYRMLSQKYHPDKNPGNPEAARIMVIINASYEVLSDPILRQKHDKSIAQQEVGSPQYSAPSQESGAASENAKKLPRTSGARVSEFVSHVARNWVVYGFAAFIFLAWAMDKPNAPPPGPKPYQATPPEAPPVYVRPSSAPNGQPWPAGPGYVSGYEKQHKNGLSTVTVNNSRNDSDVFVKLVSLDGANAYPVRQFYIPAKGTFTLNKVTAGSYDIRYRDLDSGSLSRSEAFSLEEISTEGGTRFSNITMTLYKVRNGNMQTYGLSEAEF